MLYNVAVVFKFWFAVNLKLLYCSIQFKKIFL